MIIEKQKFFLKIMVFAVIALVIIIIVLSRKNDDKEIVDNVSLVEYVRTNIKHYLELSDSLSLLDSSFCIQYRVKPDEYYFYHLIDDRLGSAISLDARYKEKIVPILKKLAITSVWKYRAENFYRYELRKSYQYKPQVIVLKKADSSFVFSEGTSFSKADTTSDVNKISDDNERKVIFKLSSRIWIYL